MSYLGVHAFHVPHPDSIPSTTCSPKFCQVQLHSPIEVTQMSQNHRVWAAPHSQGLLIWKRITGDLRSRKHCLGTKNKSIHMNELCWKTKDITKCGEWITSTTTFRDSFHMHLFGLMNTHQTWCLLAKTILISQLPGRSMEDVIANPIHLIPFNQLLIHLISDSG